MRSWADPSNHHEGAKPDLLRRKTALLTPQFENPPTRLAAFTQDVRARPSRLLRAASVPTRERSVPEGPLSIIGNRDCVGMRSEHTCDDRPGQ